MLGYNRKDLDHAFRRLTEFQKLGYEITINFRPHSPMIKVSIDGGDTDKGGAISPDLIRAIKIAIENLEYEGENPDE
jgi:hypothetical protein